MYHVRHAQETDTFYDGKNQVPFKKGVEKEKM